MKHLTFVKSILSGIAAATISSTASVLIAVLLMSRYPQVAVRIFPLQRTDLEWGAFYAVDFPTWPIVIIGLFAFAVGFGWMFRRMRAQT